MGTSKTIFILLTVLLLASCKEEYLEKKPDKSLVVPVTIKDFQALLDHEEVMNQSPALGVLGADEYYFTPDRWAALIAVERNGYIWNKEIYEGSSIADWNSAYVQVFYSNVVLEGLNKIPPTEATLAEYNQLKGSALFYRANAFFNLAQVFAPPYQSASASLSGIPLRLSPDINEVSRRAGLSETYDRILKDLNLARDLVPAKVSFKTRISKPAVHALLSRVYLIMQDYEKALAHANSALALNSSLLDYNVLNSSASRPVPANNAEVIFNSLLVSRSFLRTAVRDTVLYRSYHVNDLRRTIFFTAAGNFRGTYSGNLNFFAGLANDELYLTRAECLARKGEKDAAMAAINDLLIKRYRTGTFIPLTTVDNAGALNLILWERRKELFFRGNRWMDLRRLNLDAVFAVTLTRKLNNDMYALPANDNRYTYPIPDEEIKRSGIEQNPR